MNGTDVSIGPISSTRKTIIFGFSFAWAVDNTAKITDGNISANHKRILGNRNIGDGMVKPFSEPWILLRDKFEIKRYAYNTAPASKRPQKSKIEFQ